jgi:hypothetical protein
MHKHFDATGEHNLLYNPQSSEILMPHDDDSQRFGAAVFAEPLCGIIIRLCGACRGPITQPSDYAFSSFVRIAHELNLRTPLSNSRLIDTDLVNPEILCLLVFFLVLLEKEVEVLPDHDSSIIDVNTEYRR